ncbi:MAG: M15 family metallopeptidase [Longimicrobiales bacterium]
MVGRALSWARFLGLALVVGVVPACASRGPVATAPLDCPAPEDRPRLVRVTAVDSTIREDIRYATTDNFTGRVLPGYEVGAALLRPDAAAALARVQDRLARWNLGLLVWDAYRPVRATLEMVAWAERTTNGWVVDQGYVARRSNHNRGNTVDVTAVPLGSGRPLDMGTEYDHFGAEAHTANASGSVLTNRRILLDAMEAEGWRNYEKEWWHFTYPGEEPFIDVPIGCYVVSSASSTTGPVSGELLTRSGSSRAYRPDGRRTST